MNKRQLNQQINRFKREFNIDDTDIYTPNIKKYLENTTKSHKELIQSLVAIFKRMESIKEFKRLLGEREAEENFNKGETRDKSFTYMCACIYAYKKGA